MSRNQGRQAIRDDPWATPDSQRPDVPASYTAAIAAAVVSCQHCGDPVGLTESPATAPAITCTSCISHEVRRIVGRPEPPF